MKLNHLSVRCRHCNVRPGRFCRTPRGIEVPAHLVRRTAVRDLQAELDDWNAAHPVGTVVRAYPGLRPDDPSAVRFAPVTEITGHTRTQAWLPDGQERPVVMINNYSSWIALTHIDVI